jgi:hypothetical protein
MDACMCVAARTTALIVFGMPRLTVDLDLVEAALYTAPHVSNMRASEGLVR